MTAMIAYALFVLALLGHIVLWIALFNRMHAMAIPRRVLELLRAPHMAIIVVLPVWSVWQLSISSAPLSPQNWLSQLSPWWWCYAAVCWVLAVHGTIGWLERRWVAAPAALASNHTTAIDIAAELGRPPIGDLMTACFSALPGQEMFQLHIQEKTLAVPRLPGRLDGLTILHLSDLHFSGRIGRAFFETVVEHANDLQCDVAAVTGDIMDSEPCLDWLPLTLGRLRTRLGAYFVLGNHDLRLRDTPALRKALRDLGLVDLGGRWESVSLNGEHVLLAGNEWPWFGPRPAWPCGSDERAELPQFRILLSHSPDQIDWARRHGFQLMLAGHTHGGQIRLPLLGPVFAPSLYGVRYASGVFYEAPTLMHVSRGISGLDTIRFHCPPELAKLVLRSA